MKGGGELRRAGARYIAIDSSARESIAGGFWWLLIRRAANQSGGGPAQGGRGQITVSTRAGRSAHASERPIMPVGLAPARLGSIGGRADFTEPIQGRETREANGGAKRLIGLAKPRFDASFFHQNVGQQRLPPASGGRSRVEAKKMDSKLQTKTMVLFAQTLSLNHRG